MSLLELAKMEARHEGTCRAHWGQINHESDEVAPGVRVRQSHSRATSEQNRA